MVMIHESSGLNNGAAAAFARGRFLYGRGNPIIRGDIILI
jgi:hypothetical protein